MGEDVKLPGDSTEEFFPFGRLARYPSFDEQPYAICSRRGGAFFARHGWHIVECRSALEEAARLQREMPFGWLFRWMVPFYPGVLQDIYRHLITYLLLHRA